jgi:hypothetical protein
MPYLHTTLNFQLNLSHASQIPTNETSSCGVKLAPAKGSKACHVRTKPRPISSILISPTSQPSQGKSKAIASIRAEQQQRPPLKNPPSARDGIIHALHGLLQAFAAAGTPGVVVAGPRAGAPLHALHLRVPRAQGAAVGRPGTAPARGGLHHHRLRQGTVRAYARNLVSVGELEYVGDRFVRAWFACRWARAARRPASP